MFAEAVDIFGGATPYIGGGIIGLIIFAMVWVGRMSNRAMDRGDARDEQQWSRMTSDNDRLRKENRELRSDVVRLSSENAVLRAAHEGSS